MLLSGFDRPDALNQWFGFMVIYLRPRQNSTRLLDRVRCAHWISKAKLLVSIRDSGSISSPTSRVS